MGVRLNSISAYREMVESGRAQTQSARIIKIVAKRANMSLQEITKLYRRDYQWIELSSVSARVNQLKKDNVFAEEVQPRKCTVSKRTVTPVRVAT